MARVRVYLVDLAARATDEQRVSLALSVLPTSYEGPWKRYSETVIHANEPRRVLFRSSQTTTGPSSLSPIRFPKLRLGRFPLFARVITRCSPAT